MTNDKIEKIAVLKAPLEKVWRAVTDATAFGTWFGMRLEGPFEAGRRVRGTIAKTQVDDEIAAHQAPYVGMPCDLFVERVEPMEAFSFRWHPGGDPDTSEGAPTTLVTFTFEAVEGGTRLTITETGFDALPLERRAKAFADNDGGWEAQLSLVAKFLARGA